MFRILLVTLVSGILMFSIAAQDTPPANLTEECVTDYDPNVDYFPDKVEVNDAENFSVEYFNNYKVVTVAGSVSDYEFVLVQCGTPAPETDNFGDDVQFIEVPAGDMISLSSTFLPSITQLGLAENVIGLDSLIYTNTPEIIERIEAGEITEVAPGFELNIELVLDADPTLVMSDDFDQERIAALTDADVFTAINTDYLEGTPLGRAEWIKYTALYFNEEATAEETYADIVTAYNEVRDIAAEIPENDRPDVLWNAPFAGEWAIPGGETFAGRLLADAGADVVLSDPEDESVQIYAVEAVYEAGLDADIWITNLFQVSTLDDLLAQDPRFADFEAVQNGNVWNNNLDENEFGGNNYFELGVTNPHLVLSDLVAIFHPEILPDHEFNFMRPLRATE